MIKFNNASSDPLPRKYASLVKNVQAELDDPCQGGVTHWTVSDLHELIVVLSPQDFHVKPVIVIPIDAPNDYSVEFTSASDDEVERGLSSTSYL